MKCHSCGLNACMHPRQPTGWAARAAYTVPSQPEPVYGPDYAGIGQVAAPTGSRFSTSALGTHWYCDICGWLRPDDKIVSAFSFVLGGESNSILHCRDKPACVEGAINKICCYDGEIWYKGVKQHEAKR